MLLYFLGERAREEWVGDLRASRRMWQKQRLAPWRINMWTLRDAIKLLFAQFRCWFYDRTFAKYWGTPRRKTRTKWRTTID